MQAFRQLINSVTLEAVLLIKNGKFPTLQHTACARGIVIRTIGIVFEGF